MDKKEKNFLKIFIDPDNVRAKGKIQTKAYHKFIKHLNALKQTYKLTDIEILGILSLAQGEINSYILKDE